MFNFQSAKVQTQKYFREGTGQKREQNFKLKYRPFWSKVGSRKAEKEGLAFQPVLSHEFRFSDAAFEQLGLAGKSLVHLVSKDPVTKAAVGVAFAIVEEGHDKATAFVKKGNNDKNPNFKHAVMERDYAEAGLLVVPVIDDQENVANADAIGKSQKLDFQYIADIKAIPTHGKDFEVVAKGQGYPVYEVIIDTTSGEDEEEDLTPEEIEDFDDSADQMQEDSFGESVVAPEEEL